MQRFGKRNFGTWPRFLAPFAAFAIAGNMAAIAETPQTPPAEPPAAEDCFEDLEKGTRAEIVCYFPLKLSPIEQAELEKGSRGYIKNVDCTMTIKVARSLVEAAITASDHVFQSPEQPVSCTVTTHKSSFDITATFAPRVVFKGDVAVEASPGLANVKGVSRVISWPVVQFVNRWPSIRKGLMQVVDANRAHRRKSKAAR